VVGKLTCGCTADEGVGGGGSNLFAWVFRIVGECVAEAGRLRDAPGLCATGEGVMEV